jgi:hypothetical protein
MNTVARAQGRWQEILPQLGIEPRFLRNKHGPCPLCGGRDRFRFDDREDTGSYYCSQCGPGAGILLIRKLKGWDHKTACDEVDKIIGTEHVAPKANPRKDDPQARRRAIERILEDARQPDVVVAYLQRRGLAVSSPVLRGFACCPYWDDDDHRWSGGIPLSSRRSSDRSVRSRASPASTTQTLTRERSSCRRSARSPVPRSGSMNHKTISGSLRASRRRLQLISYSGFQSGPHCRTAASSPSSQSAGCADSTFSPTTIPTSSAKPPPITWRIGSTETA